jgi:23S rRNA (uracil1939-C5)-methyltransferase
MSAAERVVTSVGTEGDGRAGELFIPFVLPDEIVRVQQVSPTRAVAEAMLRPSPDRVEPPCAHFGSCGGCSLQHWRREAYLAWKAGLLAAALARSGFSCTSQIVPGRPGSRRRADFALRRTQGGVAVGFHERAGKSVIDVRECHVLHPDLVALLPPLRHLCARLQGFRREGSAIINLLDSGPDVLLRTDAALNAADRSALAAFAAEHGVPRISHAIGPGESETACQLRPAATMMSGVEVFPPPGSFLQATRESEAAIIAAVLAGLPEGLSAKAVVAELYAGCGTLTFAMSPHVRVHAWEGDAGSAAALADAARRHGRVTAKLRDLARQPLQAAEFARYAAVVLDPPWAGAATQMPQIAKAGVKRVIYVSCNPATLARDAALLAATGYQLESATAIDQFLWSARLEAVAVFSLDR